MSHNAEHQYHLQALDQSSTAQQHLEHKGKRRLGNIHPAWYLALGLTMTLIATLTWTLLYPGSF